jgi:hypothetical protein
VDVADTTKLEEYLMTKAELIALCEATLKEATRLDRLVLEDEYFLGVADTLRLVLASLKLLADDAK